MIVKARFCQALIENSLRCFSNIPFTLHGETRPSAEDLSVNPINIYYLSEPNEYTGNKDYIYRSHNLYDYVLTWDKDLLIDLPNAVFCPFGTSAFHDKLSEPLLEGNYRDKEEKITFIRGDKHASVIGHDFRHELYRRKNEITNIKTEFYERTTPDYARNAEEDIQWFKQRTHIFKTPLYHICIENTSHENYFTEKIIDCFLFRTIPIYFGCPNIVDYFDTRGIVRFDSVSECITLCNSLTRDFYEERIYYVYKNQISCMKYLNMGNNIKNVLVDIFEKKYPKYLNLIK